MDEQPVGDAMSFIIHHSSFILLLAVWLFTVGGAVGSFLNVVVYRLPLGLSLIAPGSHCPACKHPIRWHDNVPIFGWILLRGRCRDCRSSISARYPLVETISAVLFLTVGAVEWFTFSENLPQRPIAGPNETDFAMLSAGESLGLVVYHLLLLSTLLAAALIQYDGRRLPLRLFLPAIVVGAAAPLVWPHLRPVPAVGGLFEPVAGLFDGVAGVIVGLLLGHAARLIIGPRDRRELPIGFAMAGIFFGWQAILALGLIVVAIHAVTEALRPWWPGLSRTSPGIWLFLGAWTWILTWRALVEGIKIT
jgi:leader peptidase (prepilin peptidase)/N-methyltransferase